MNTAFRRRNESEQGIALLFALGLLTLLMLISAAFVTNSLLFQKAAVAHGRALQSRHMLRAGVNNLRLTLQLYALTAGSSAYGYDWIASKVPVGDDRRDSGTNAHSDRLNEHIGAPGSNDYQPALLAYLDPDSTQLINSGTLDKDMIRGYNPPDDKWKKAEWAFIKDSAGRLIGRYAYAVLPGTATAGIPGTTAPAGIPLSLIGGGLPRNGVSVAEIPLLTPTGLGALSPPSLPDVDRRKMKTFGQLFNKVLLTPLARAQVRMLYTMSPPAEMEAYFFDNEDGDGLRGNGSGDYVIEPVSPGGAVLKNPEWYHRFNLARPATEWAALSVDTLLGETAAAREGAIYHKRNGNRLELNGSGSDMIQFLRMVGDTPGAFTDMAARRRQVAANMLDFFSFRKDTASTDVSDWAALNPGDVMPTFTGNVLAPQLSEIGIKLAVTLSTTVTSDGTNTFFTVTPAVELTAAAELLDCFGSNGVYNVSLKGFTLPSLKVSCGTSSQTFTLSPPSDFVIPVTVGHTLAAPFTQLFSAATAPVSLGTGSVTLNLTGVGMSADVSAELTGNVGVALAYVADSLGRRVDFAHSVQAVVSAGAGLVPAKSISGDTVQDTKELLTGLSAMDPFSNLNQNGTGWFLEEKGQDYTPASLISPNAAGSGQIFPDTTRAHRFFVWATTTPTAFSPSILTLIHRGSMGEWFSLYPAAPAFVAPVFSAPAKYDPLVSLGLAGASAAEGDGGILDQIKMTSSAVSYGKVDLNARDLKPTEPAGAFYSFSQLFYNIPRTDLLIDSAPTLIQAEAPLLAEKLNNKDLRFTHRAAAIPLIAKEASTLSTPITGEALNELIGRSITLTKAGELSNMIRAVVVAQSIREATQNNLNVSLYTPDGTTKIPFVLNPGEFNVHILASGECVYGDDITGTSRMLVTIVRDVITGKISVVEREYLD